MKLPEYLLSTPRFIAVMLAIWLIIFTFMEIVDAKEYVAATMLVLWYFFGSRGKEEKKEEKYDNANPLESNLN